jgi:4-hydroxy-2-oxoheptanedioate aldolase
VRENNVRKAWREGRPALNCWLSSCTPLQAEMLAPMGFDSFVVDMQHGEFDYMDLVAIFTALAGHDTAPMARVPWNDPSAIMRILDAGALGLICPMVNTAEEAKRFVDCCRYPPAGHRSSAPMRAHLHHRTTFEDYVTSFNDQVVTIALIETRQALENIEAILDTPGLDAIYVGSSDMSLSHGGPVGVHHEDPASGERHARIGEAARRHGVRFGLHTTRDEDLEICLGHGAELITVADATALLASGSEDRLAAARAVATNIP